MMRTMDGELVDKDFAAGAGVGGGVQHGGLRVMTERL
jgi:hypothetical protein